MTTLGRRCCHVLAEGGSPSTIYIILKGNQMTKKELILDFPLAGFIVEVVNPILIPGNPKERDTDSVDWERVQLKDDPLKRDMTDFMDPNYAIALYNKVLLSFKQS